MIHQLLHKVLVDLVRDELKTIASPKNAVSPPIEAMAQFLGGGLFGLLIWWGTGKMRMPVEEVNALFRRLATGAVTAGIS